jgi:hypothetical protein
VAPPKEGAARAIRGSLRHDDGTVDAARFYYGDDEPTPLNRERINPDRYAMWIEDDGVVGIRRGTSVTIGASKQYSSKYDQIDWGN